MMKIAKFGVVFLAVLLTLAVSVFAQPAMTAISAQTVNEGSLLSFTATSSAADNPAATTPVTFRFCYITTVDNCALTTPNAFGFSEIVVGATKANISNVSGTTAQFNWTPSFTQEGTYKFNISANDGNSYDSVVFTVTVNDAAPSITVPATLSLGGTSQKRSNPNHDRVEDRIVNVTSTFTITNGGNEQLTDIAASLALGSDASKASKGGLALTDLNNKITIDKSSLAAGESASVTIELNVPAKLSAVDSAGIETAWNVANIAVTGKRTASGHTSETVTSSTKVNLQAENHLEIKDAKITFAGKSENLDNGDEVNDIRPGDTIQMEFEVENKFNDRDDVTIEDIELTVENDDDLDIDETEDLSDLDAEDTDTVVVEFDVDDDVPRGDQDVDITLLGEDENGAVHGERWDITIQIDREDHEIDIRELTLNPETVSCETEATLLVDIRNTGRRDEDEVYVRVNAPELQYNRITEELSLDQDDESSERFVIPIPETLGAGTYRISVDTYYDTSDKSDTDGIILRKQACSTEAPVDEPVVDDKEPVVVVTPTPTPETEQPEVQMPVEEKSFFDSTAFMVLLVLGYVAVLGGGALVAIKLLRK